MNKRHYGIFEIALLLKASCLALLAYPNEIRNGDPNHPNVIMIAVDDMNTWLGPLGDRQAITPNLDKLAARGVTFTNPHTAAPLEGRRSRRHSRRPKKAARESKKIRPWKVAGVGDCRRNHSSLFGLYQLCRCDGRESLGCSRKES